MIGGQLFSRLLFRSWWFEVLRWCILGARLARVLNTESIIGSEVSTKIQAILQGRWPVALGFTAFPNFAWSWNLIFFLVMCFFRGTDGCLVVSYFYISIAQTLLGRIFSKVLGYLIYSVYIYNSNNKANMTVRKDNIFYYCSLYYCKTQVHQINN